MSGADYELANQKRENHVRMFYVWKRTIREWRCNDEKMVELLSRLAVKARFITKIIRLFENFEFLHSTVFLNHWWNSKKKILVRELNEPLKCQICSGYLINPTVVNECQHTFCKTVSDWWGKEFPVNSNKNYPLNLVFSAFWTIMKTSLTVQFVALFLIRRLQKNL